MNTLEIAHSEPLKFIKIYVNQELIAECHESTGLVAEIDRVLPVTIEVEFQPFKIKPIVRYNNFMLNYWLANIVLYDHKLEFELGNDFYQAYKNKDIEGRLAHLSAEEKALDNLYDKYIGVNNLHPTLVAEIKALLSQ